MYRDGNSKPALRSAVPAARAQHASLRRRARASRLHIPRPVEPGLACFARARTKPDTETVSGRRGPPAREPAPSAERGGPSPPSPPPSPADAAGAPTPTAATGSGSGGASAAEARGPRAVRPAAAWAGGRRVRAPWGRRGRARARARAPAAGLCSRPHGPRGRAAGVGIGGNSARLRWRGCWAGRQRRGAGRRRPGGRRIGFSARARGLSITRARECARACARVRARGLFERSLCVGRCESCDCARVSRRVRASRARERALASPAGLRVRVSGTARSPPSRLQEDPRASGWPGRLARQ
jgi:hypothetical protein